MRRAFRRLGVGALVVGAAVWFHAAIGGGIGLADEGQIVYPSWEVARGAAPYVDFRHLYGPSVFFLNGALLRQFGADLRVVRLGLVVVKTAAAVLVYVLSRRVASRGTALLAYGFLLAVWGAPLWFFNTPYATYYATMLSLAAVAIASGPCTARRALASGFGFGLATTFKQTQGIFGFCAFALFVLVVTRGAPGPTVVRSVARALAGILRLLAPLAVLALAVAYIGPQRARASAWAVILPALVGAALVLAREIAAWPPSDAAVGGVRVIAAATIGMVLPALAYVALYVHLGGVGALVHDTATELPQRIAWYAPLRMPERRVLALVGTVASLVGVLGSARSRSRGLPLAAGAALAASAALLVSLASRSPGIAAYFVGGSWTNDLLAVLPWAAFPVLAAGLIAARRPAAQDLPLLLVLFAAATVMQLYPAADIPHGTMILPAILPVLALAVDGLLRGRIRAARVVLLLVLAGTAWPFVRPRFAPAAADAAPFARASGVAATDARSREAAALVRHLADAGARDGELLVLTDEQLVYFLAGVRSALRRDEFALYLIGAGLVTDATARTLVDEDAAVARLARLRPLVVDHEGSDESARVRRALPRLAAFIARTYEVSAAVDGYRVLAPRAR